MLSKHLVSLAGGLNQRSYSFSVQKRWNNIFVLFVVLCYKLCEIDLALELRIELDLYVDLVLFKDILDLFLGFNNFFFCVVIHQDYVACVVLVSLDINHIDFNLLSPVKIEGFNCFKNFIYSNSLFFFLGLLGHFNSFRALNFWCFWAISDNLAPWMLTHFKYSGGLSSWLRSKSIQVKCWYRRAPRSHSVVDSGKDSIIKLCCHIFTFWTLTWISIFDWGILYFLKLRSQVNVFSILAKIDSFEAAFTNGSRVLGSKTLRFRIWS